ncbi:PIG-L family deacetylase [Marinoscillum furvescens]|uniref:GlcNAc-PI de-N-acetylase n=1 Tax=Marinoscillum furvescens DSM 4134 TaxID=1122208 RepID=A0A3D9L1N3_MARFU|nr:PIG-L family deacetylase [Marinoscillum furvescens]RED97007.1 GlcNAc-PI de-N-acetylase [Marinoscillum furvescens DSM 4134]
MARRSIFIALTFFLINSLAAQQSYDYSTGEVLQRLQRLNTLGSVLYIAAHPDDENTQLIAYLANQKHLRTGYLAATRGDGGQNLIGPEIREGLGVIRTQELLEARKIDGGEQFFSRANDFGYSKNPDETFNKWDKDKVLADFVWAIRKFKPDVLITRFSRVPGVTHGHHTASAVLAMEAFELSGDATAFPEQLRYVDPWQPKRVFYNIGLWSYRRSGKVFDPTGYVKLDVGKYNPVLGISCTEIAAKSRSMHKSQGFGVSGIRGSEYEYFEQWAGDSTTTLFGGLDMTWNRVQGAEEVAYFVNEAMENYNPLQPADILGSLLKAREALLKLPDQYWKEVKLQELQELMLAVTGTYISMTSDRQSYVPGDSPETNLEVINRSNAPIRLSSVRFSISDERFIYRLNLDENTKTQFSYNLTLPKNTALSNPYWLNKPGTDGMYRVDKQLLRGLPQNPPAISATITLTIDGQFIDVEVPVNYQYTDPVKGEVNLPLVVSPPVMVNLDDQALIFGNGSSQKVPVKIIAGQEGVKGDVRLAVEEGWSYQPERFTFDLERVHEEVVFEFELTPPAGASVAQVRAEALVDSRTYRQGRQVIAYDHIPQQTLFPEAETRAVKLDLKRGGQRIGYIMGAGDAVPNSLEQIGYEVQLLAKDDVVQSQLATFDAVIVGIRAFNTLSWLSYKNNELFEYAKSGGTVIVQYNTSHRLVTEQVAPLALKLSRDRVTVEEAPVEFLAPKHDVLNSPNKITAADFDGWVQERGLYFPSEWHKDFTPILGMSDPGEEQTKGSLLVAKYGRGYYCYTGISFFRELPAGVPGAYKLLVNMISLGNKQTP